MSSMKDAIRRLQIIDSAYNPKNQDKPDDTKMDDFTRVKQQIGANVKAVRQMIKERDELSKADKSSKKGVGGGTETAESSFRIRSLLKNIKEDIHHLDTIVKKAEKKIKGKKRPDLQEIIDSRKEIVKLCYQHLEECEHLDKARFNEKMASDRVNLFTTSGTTSTSPSTASKFGAAVAAGATAEASLDAGNGVSELPDIEVQEDLALIRQRGMDIDQELDEIAAGVTVIKQIAVQMGEEVDKQNDMLTEIEDKVDRTQDHMLNVNVKMKEALDGVMKGDKFLVNCVLICILLGLVAYIVSQLIP